MRKSLRHNIIIISYSCCTHSIDHAEQWEANEIIVYDIVWAKDMSTLLCGQHEYDYDSSLAEPLRDYVIASLHVSAKN